MLVFWVFCKRFDKSGINILWQFFISVLFSSFPGEKFWLPEYSEYSSSAALNRIRYFHLGGKGGIWIRETGPQGGWETECCCYWRRRKREFATQQSCSKRGEKEEKGQLANCSGGSFVSRIFLHHVWKCFWFLLFCVDWDVTVEKNKQQWSPRILVIASQSCPWFPGKSIISRCWHGKLMCGVSERGKGELIANRSRDQTRSFLKKKDYMERHQQYIAFGFPLRNSQRC